jgi:hypothetical protein
MNVAGDLSRHADGDVVGIRGRGNALRGYRLSFATARSIRSNACGSISLELRDCAFDAIERVRGAIP